MAEELGEKTEQPTSKRIEDARREGQVARSQNRSAAIMLASAMLLLYVMGDHLLEGFAASMVWLLSPDMLIGDLTTTSVMPGVIFAGQQAVRLTVPFLVILALIAAAEQIQQVGWLLSSKPLTPKLSRMNPISGTKRLFSKRSLVKLVVDLAKVALIAVVGYMVIHSDYEQIIALPKLTLPAVLVVISELVIHLSIWAIAILLIIGLLDRIYQKWQHTEDIKMTKQEVKDERKSVEGDVETKGRRFKLARDMINQAVRKTVPNADVVVANPTHFAVALKYDSDEMRAPRVVAKGADYLALRIRMIASVSGVPIVERPPLARALHRQCEIGQEIPGELYEAVAEVLAYVYRLDRKAAS